MAVAYTRELHQDILERLEMQAVVCNATPRTAPAITILEAFALLAEIERLQSAEKELKERFTLIFNKWRSRRRDLIRRVQAEALAEGWDEGYQDKASEASEAMIERGLRERAKNPYKENQK